MKVCWIVLCRDEEDIIPFVVPYWRRVADHVVVFDNGSTDSSIELLSKYDWIEIRQFQSEGHNDLIHKEIKERAYLEFKSEYDVVICTDMDEVFYFDDFKALVGKMIDGGYNILSVPIYALCEDFKPPVEEGKYLHEQCHKFFKQRMNHIKGFEGVAKFSIFNTKITDKVMMSVGQHIVQTTPCLRIMHVNNGFCLHINKGFGAGYFIDKRRKMGSNLSDTNRRFNMGIEYLKSEEDSIKEYLNNQKQSFDINDFSGNYK